MGGGFTFAGNSAARPPLFAASGITRNFQTPNSVTLNISSGSQPCLQNTGHCDCDCDCVFGPIPSRLEVERAILQLQRFMSDLSAYKSELNGLHGLLYGHELEMLQSPGFIKFNDAFSMMQSEPSIQNLVVSISSDKAVWEAIMINKAVQDLQGSISADAAKEEKKIDYPEEPDIAILIVKWIMGFTKSKVLELLEKFGLLVNEIFRPSPKEKPTSEPTDLLDEKVRSSLLLSVVILLIVLVTRGQS